MDNIKKKLGLNIKRYRLLRGLTQNELAEIVGVEDKTISRIEVGGNYPSMDLLVKIANALGYDIAQLVNFTDTIDSTILELDKTELKAIKKFLGLLSGKLR
ncbi:helix-turn-helix transcriptional regulator [bacterium]|nr:helix-turn-helix transcriptional regulator [bacterium]